MYKAALLTAIAASFVYLIISNPALASWKDSALQHLNVLRYTSAETNASTTSAVQEVFDQATPEAIHTMAANTSVSRTVEKSVLAIEQSEVRLPSTPGLVRCSPL
jgi:hypothetical protein